MRIITNLIQLKFVSDEDNVGSMTKVKIENNLAMIVLFVWINEYFFIIDEDFLSNKGSIIDKIVWEDDLSVVDSVSLLIFAVSVGGMA